MLPALRHELHYWRAATWLARGDAKAALDEASTGLRDLGQTPPDETEWRLAAVGAAAARRLHDEAHAGALSARGRAALDRLRGAWKSAAATYDRRPDLRDLRRDAGFPQP